MRALALMAAANISGSTRSVAGFGMLIGTPRVVVYRIAEANGAALHAVNKFKTSRKRSYLYNELRIYT